MATQAILGLFDDASAAADAGDALKASGITESDYHFLTDIPYPEGAFGEPMERHALFVWPIVGGILGLVLALIVAGMTPLAVPMTTGPQTHPGAAAAGGDLLRRRHAGRDPVHCDRDCDVGAGAVPVSAHRRPDCHRIDRRAGERWRRTGAPGYRNPERCGRTGRYDQPRLDWPDRGDHPS